MHGLGYITRIERQVVGNRTDPARVVQIYCGAFTLIKREQVKGRLIAYVGCGFTVEPLGGSDLLEGLGMGFPRDPYRWYPWENNHSGYNALKQLHGEHMGIDLNSAQFLASSYKNGVSFGKTITLGRQGLLFTRDEMATVLHDYARLSNEGELSPDPQELTFADEFFHILGAEEVVSVDYSDFEGATIIHDLNIPVPNELKGQFDLVFDGGTLEHIFNFPIALKSCLEMVKLGGHFITHTPSNNYCGHGFYQFSPELFFRTLSETNGFHIERIVAVDMMGGKWFSVTDPELIRRRIELINFHPIQLFVQARKISENNIFQLIPQQSDYKMVWDDHGLIPTNNQTTGSLVRKWRHNFVMFLTINLPFSIDIIRLLFSNKMLFRDKAAFTPIDKMH